MYDILPITKIDLYIEHKWKKWNGKRIDHFHTIVERLRECILMRKHILKNVISVATHGNQFDFDSTNETFM